ncbi:hypothetical protein H4R26_000831 [Coemansia thaxteri]|uniref:Major facilitator superfamily (MFS) profile domain-containing protein n=1 Tax=Coemansia thaxteri TaxID=2663907 RepID=A0A9W8BG01_9FUNG|nr:hypothetical protein H4R26_000831 [Coemansia thaxteri]KAJ2487562.1 hypothetical protein EV174_000457 [Coemansia sp. RSA 2320]
MTEADVASTALGASSEADECGSTAVDSQPTERVHMLTSGSICLLMFLIGLYTTMDAVIYIPIANEFNSLSRAEWIINGYLITTTALQPIYGKVSDIVGRSPAMVAASLLLLAGSVASALAQSMNVLILSRAIQGLGSAGMYTMVNVVIADIYDERARGRFMGVSSGIWALASSGAVVLGGAIVQYSSWRVAFWINIPICVIAAVVILSFIRLPVPSGGLRDKVRRIDFGGSLLSLLGIILVLLALSWGGRDHPWNSAPVICCLVFGILALALFVAYEHRVPLESLVPMHLLRTRNIALSFLGHLFFGAITYAPLMFIPQWALVVRNTTPITSGLYTLPFTLAELVAVVAAGAWVTRSGRYRECVWLGSALLLAGLTPLVLLDQYSGLGYIIGFQLVAGLGFGLCIQTLILTAQASASGRDSAAATSVCIFMRSLGAILVVAVLSSVNGNKLRSEFANVSKDYPDYSNAIAKIAENQTLIHQLDLPLIVFDRLVNAFMEGMRAAFTALIPFSALFLLTVVGIRHCPLKTTRKVTIA